MLVTQVKHNSAGEFGITQDQTKEMENFLTTLSEVCGGTINDETLLDVSHYLTIEEYLKGDQLDDSESAQISQIKESITDRLPFLPSLVSFLEELSPYLSKLASTIVVDTLNRTFNQSTQPSQFADLSQEKLIQMAKDDPTLKTSIALGLAAMFEDIIKNDSSIKFAFNTNDIQQTMLNIGTLVTDFTLS